MSNFPKYFNELVKSLSRFPGIGRRSAERMAFYILKMRSEETKDLARKIEEVQKHIRPCKLCNNFSTQDICSLCGNPKREKDILCIVEEPKDIIAVEKTSRYNGLYYVLLGALSPLEGVNEENLNISKLMQRLEEGEIKEVIIATDPDNDGELTAHFLIEKISPYKVKIYRIAIGVPLGTQIEYIDSATLGKALLERKAVT
ncbi:MAG: recombination protein RecR [Candidatus Omnitrophota bacterium]|nr:MAG: recombination protein RecR [Candidatus Omnitrophota bacterium]